MSEDAQNGAKATISKYLAEYQLTGICVVNIDAIAADWSDDTWVIVQHGEGYRLHCDGQLKCTISKAQAHALIGQLDLVDTPSSFFKLARSWRKTHGER